MFGVECRRFSLVCSQAASKLKSVDEYVAANPDAATGASSMRKTLEDAATKRVIRASDGFQKCRRLGCGQYYGALGPGRTHPLACCCCAAVHPSAVLQVSRSVLSRAASARLNNHGRAPCVGIVVFACVPSLPRVHSPAA